MADNSTERCFSGHSIVSSHYQSRLFNFLTDRAVRWSDRAATAFRHAQLAATTAVQTVLLPLWAIAENLGWRAFPYEGLGGQRRDRANFAPGADRDQVSSDAPIRATLTVLDATGWPTVDRFDRDALQSAQQTPPATPPPLELTLGRRELGALAPTRTATATVRGLASQLGSADLVLVSTENKIVGRLGAFPQQTLDRDVTKLLDRLAPFPPLLEPPRFALLQQAIAQLDFQWAKLEARALPPSGFESGRQFDLHRDLNRDSSLAIGNFFERQVSSWTRSLLPPTQNALPAEPESRTKIRGSQWSIDPEDLWWRNAIDLVRASFAASISSVTAIVKTRDSDAETDRPPDLPTPEPQTIAPRPEIQSKVGNQIRDWLGDRAPQNSSLAVGDRARPPVAIFRPEADATSADRATSPNLAASSPKTTAPPDFEADWYEAEAEDSGYVMHPLERLLRWLDRLLVTLEGWIDRAVEAILAWWSRRRAS